MQCRGCLAALNMIFQAGRFVEELLTGDTLGRLSFSKEDLTTGLTCFVAWSGFRYGTFLSSLVKINYFKLLSFGNISEPSDGDIVKEPKSSSSLIRHDVTSLDLNCTC